MNRKSTSYIEEKKNKESKIDSNGCSVFQSIIGCSVCLILVLLLIFLFGVVIFGLINKKQEISLSALKRLEKYELVLNTNFKDSSGEYFRLYNEAKSDGKIFNYEYYSLEKEYKKVVLILDER
jgi:hypothetical protein